MYKSPLRVSGEYLVDPAAAAATMTGTNIVRMGKSMSGLEVVVCLEGDDPEQEIALSVGDAVSISLLHSLDGETFLALPVRDQVIGAPEDEPGAVERKLRPGDIIARMTIPGDCLPYVKGSLEFSRPPAARVSMFPAYLPR